MTYDYKSLFATILSAVATDGAFSARMATVIDECARQLPSAAWERFRDIPFDEGARSLSDWLRRAFGVGWRQTESKGLWFGLVQVQYDEDVVADMYVSASPTFRPDSIDWAEGTSRNGEAAYMRSESLAAIYRLAYGQPDQLGNAAEYPLVLSYGAMTARAALEIGQLPAALRSAKGAAVGYDDGDFLFLGEFNDARFRACIRAG